MVVAIVKEVTGIFTMNMCLPNLHVSFWKALAKHCNTQVAHLTTV